MCALIPAVPKVTLASVPLRETQSGARAQACSPSSSVSESGWEETLSLSLFSCASSQT